MTRLTSCFFSLLLFVRSTFLNSHRIIRCVSWACITCFRGASLAGENLYEFQSGVVFNEILCSILPPGRGSNCLQLLLGVQVFQLHKVVQFNLHFCFVHRYALIVLWADDNGNGGTFALYSLLRRQGELGVRGRALPSELELSHYGPGSLAKSKAQSMQSGWRQRVANNTKLRKVVRILVVIGVGAILGDGVLTPAISGVFLPPSVMSSVGGYSAQQLEQGGHDEAMRLLNMCLPTRIQFVALKFGTEYGVSPHLSKLQVSSAFS